MLIMFGFLIAVPESVLLAYRLGLVIPYQHILLVGVTLMYPSNSTVASIVFVRRQVELCGIVFT